MAPNCEAINCLPKKTLNPKFNKLANIKDKTSKVAPDILRLDQILIKSKSLSRINYLLADNVLGLLNRFFALEVKSMGCFRPIMGFDRDFINSPPGGSAHHKQVNRHEVNILD